MEAIKIEILASKIASCAGRSSLSLFGLGFQCYLQGIDTV